MSAFFYKKNAAQKLYFPAKPASLPRISSEAGACDIEFFSINYKFSSSTSADIVASR